MRFTEIKAIRNYFIYITLNAAINTAGIYSASGGKETRRAGSGGDKKGIEAVTVYCTVRL